MAALVGRTREIEALRAALAAARAAQLVGPAGIGKSTVAEAALGARVRVPLEPVPVGGLIPAIAAALDVPAEPEAVAGALARAEAILLDGAEAHVDAVSGWVAEIRARAPSLQVVVTTQVRVPGPLVALEIGPLDAEDGVRLFRDRAREVAGELPDDDLDVRALVDRLGAWPLALALAASRMRVFTPAELIAELEASPARLREVGRSDRHASLEGALDVSLRLLAPGDRAALCRIAQVRSAFGPRVFAEVTGEPPEVLTRLVDASLARRTGDRRYGMLEPVRLFALSRLPPDDPARAAYAEAALARGEAAAARVNGSDGRAALARIQELAPDLESLLGADPIPAARAALVLGELATAHLPPDPVLAWYARVPRAGLPEALRVRLGFAEAELLTRFARTHEVRARLPALPAEDPRVALMRGIGALMDRDTERGLTELTALVERLTDGDPVVRARARMALGAAQQAEGRTDEAVASCEAGLRDLEGLDRPDLAGALRHYLALAERGRGRDGAVRAREHLLRAVEMFTALGHHKRGIGALALLCVVEADLAIPTVRARVAAVLDESRRVGATFNDSRLGLLSAQLAIEDGDLEGAREALLAMPPLRPLMESARRLILGVRAWLADDPEDARHQLALATFPDRVADAHLLACYRAVVDGAEPPDPPAGADPPLVAATALVRGRTSPVDDEVISTNLDLRMLRAMIHRRGSVEVGPDGAWFRVPGGPVVELGRKRVLARLLASLAAACGRPVPADVLRDAAWPGERMAESSAKNRLHVAMAELRRLGLRDALRSVDGGYALGAGPRGAG